MGEVLVKEAYDNGNPVVFEVRSIPSGTEIVIGEGCLPVGKHRITVEYDLYPHLRGDTLLLNVLNGEVAVPVDYVEVVVVSEGQGGVIPLDGGFNVVEVPGLEVVRISGDGPYSGDTVLNVRVRVPKLRVVRWIPLLILTVALLLHVLSGQRRA